MLKIIAGMPKGFAAFVLVAFLNAFVDLGHKILLQNTIFRTTDDETQLILTALLNAMILAPFILFFTPSGWLADRFAKPKIMQKAALLAIFITIAITICYAMGWFWASFVLTFILATQSAIYSPAKYSYIRDLVGVDRLGWANGWVQGATTTAILTGIGVFSFLFEWRLESVTSTDPNTLIQFFVPMGCALVVASIAEWLCTYRLPIIARASGPAFDWKQYLSGVNLRQSLQSVWKRQVLWLTIIGVALFWAISQVLLVVFPAHAEAVLGMHNTLHIQGLMACSGIGIVLGAGLAGRAKGHVETGFIPVGAALVAVSIILLPWLSSPWALALDFCLLGVAGGLFLVPLNALMQFHSPDSESGRVIAANNLINNICMIAFLGVSMALSAAAFTALSQIYLLALAAVCGALYTFLRLPQSGLRLVLMGLLGVRYRLRVGGLSGLPREGGVLLLGNHISFIDWAILQVACPRPIRFVMDAQIFSHPFLNWIFRLCGAIPIASGAYREALAEAKQALSNGEVVCIFPEGAITATGNLLTFRRGFEQAVLGSGATIVPFYLHGLWGSDFSRTHRAMKNIGRRALLVQFGASLPDHASAPEVKQAVIQASYNGFAAQAEAADTLAPSLLRALSHGPRCVAIDDPISGSLTRLKLAAVSLRLGVWLRRQAKDEQYCGVLLPPGSGSTIVILAAWLTGRTIVPLNYTASPEALAAAIKAAGITQVFTSERFLKRLAARGVAVEALREQVICVDIGELLGSMSKGSMLLAALVQLILPVRWISRMLGAASDNQETAAVLFSSGSEGLPKGVLLSHRALQANCAQMATVLQPRPDDCLLAALPSFHAFGLSVCMVMPLLEGVQIAAHPDPTDITGMAERIEKTQATVLLMTGTLLRLLARHPKVTATQLDSLRLVVAGAEKLQSQVRAAFFERFNKTIYEGYGTTEMAPVVSANLPDYALPGTSHRQLGQKIGTVGQPLPGTRISVVDPDTFDPLPVGEAGLVLLAGPQMMQGYLNQPERSAKVLKVLAGCTWYLSGDKGFVDEDGYLTLVDRYARFAKIAGEMISLGAVEQALHEALMPEETMLVAVAVTDQNKGERIVVLSETALSASTLRPRWKALSANALMFPSAFIEVDTVPMLGSGKIDYVRAKKIAESSI